MKRNRQEYFTSYRRRRNSEINERQRVRRSQHQVDINRPTIHLELRKSTYKSAISGSSEFFFPQTHDLGPLSFTCIHCAAVHFKSELKSNCCHNGKLSNLPTSNAHFPIEIKELYIGTDRKSRNFREFIRQYNNSNAFASMGANIHNIHGSVYCFKVSGEVYHKTADNIPIDLNLNMGNVHTADADILYAELFLYDTDTAVNIRMNNHYNSACLKEIMTTIGNVLHNISPYARSYQKLREAFETESAYAAQNNCEINKVSLVFYRNLQDDQRVYNAPTNANDVALIYVPDRDGNIPAQIDFAVYPTNSRSIKRINFLSKHLDPMIFPLFYPNGDFGWTTNIPHNTTNSTAVRNTTTVLQFYAYKIAIRPTIFNPLHYGGKLFQQYIVYAYARVEANRLMYIRSNQKSLRVDSYKGLLDHMNSFSNDNNVRIGNLFILPSSFTGGPRFMSKLYQDNMAMVRKFGRPDLFITFTCNPAWPEIKSQLHSFQNASDRPDLVTRVFNLKLKEFLNDITKSYVFGKTCSYVYVIEHQKRGLPHAHCLFTLCKEDKLKSAADVDKIISAEIPNKITHPQLYDMVIKHNIHGPCGNLNPNCVCMVDGKCSKQFPKPFCEETDISKETYPKYRRRLNITSEVMPSNVYVDNRFIVPYNPFLTLKYNAHINVELCSTVKAIKYIHKYITKGHDCARIGVQVDSNNDPTAVVDFDEISQYLNCRYISAQEAAWQLQELPIHGQSHNIVMLSVHLKDGQSIFFNENSIENDLRRESIAVTTLTSFFDLNLNDPTAHNHLYQDIPIYYIFKNKKWEKRSPNSHHGNKAIGRIIAVSPKDTERYHLRLLLLSVKGREAVSFESLKSFENVVYSTYREAARARGLINDSAEWHFCLSEASQYMLPKSLRSLFVTIICHCNPSNPLQLFNDYKNYMIEDFIYSGLGEDAALTNCIISLRDLCEDVGFDLFTVLPVPNSEIYANLITAPLCIPNNEPYLWDNLNQAQRMAASNIWSSIQGINSQKYFYLDGPGGSGKTFLYRALIQKLSTINKTTLCIAWTGIAANLLPHGTTSHSAFALPLNLDCVKFPQLSKNKRKLLTSIDCLIWDEAPMAPAVALEIIDLVFRDLMKNNLPFGGKFIILGGDFRQVLPVIRGGNRVSVVNATIKKSPLWKLFQIFKLDQNMRAITDPTFCTWLLSIGDGKCCSDQSIKKTQYSLNIPNEFLSDDIVTDTFGINFTPGDVASISQRAILCPKNDDVRHINDRVLNNLNAEEVSFCSVDSVKNEDGTDDSNLQVNFPTEFLNSLNPSGLPPHILKLKKGSIVMLMRNLSIKNGLCNGTRLAVTDLQRNVIKVEILTGTVKGTTHFIPRISLDTSNDPALPFNLIRHQFPVRLAYAMTINKAQGQTFQKIGIYLPEPIFTHGQLYTALSRVTQSTALKIQIIEGPKQGSTVDDVTVTDNVVYQEVFS